MKIKFSYLLVSVAALAVIGCGGPEAEAPPSDAATKNAMSKFEAGGGQSEAPKGGAETAKPTTDN